MFSWLEKLEFKRWWNMVIVIGFVFAVLFGTKAITIIDPTAGFLLSLATLLFGIAEAASHQEEMQYTVGREYHHNSYMPEDLFRDKWQKMPPVHIPTGKKYVRKPIFIGIVLDIVAAILFLAGVAKLFV